MIEILFGESEGGGMKVAKHYKRPNCHSASAIGWIGDKEPTKEEFDQMKEAFEKKQEGKAVGGSSSEVICLPFQLDIGDIRVPVDSKYRKELILELYTMNGIEFWDSLQWFEEAWGKYLRELERLKTFAAGGEAFRIWYSNAPYSLCGFYNVCRILRDYGCKLSVIKLPQYIMLSDNVIQSFTSWGEIDAGRFYEFLPLEKELSTFEIHHFASKWTDLQEDHSLLRAVVNDQLIGVPEDFYDHLIRKELPDEEFIMARLLGTVIGKYQLGIGDAWYAKRINKMIEQGELEIVQKHKEAYHQVLKAVKSIH